MTVSEDWHRMHVERSARAAAARWKWLGSLPVVVFFGAYRVTFDGERMRICLSRGDGE